MTLKANVAELRTAVDPAPVKSAAPRAFRCTACGAAVLAIHVVNGTGHVRIGEDDDGQVYQEPCGPVEPTTLTVEEYIAMLPADWFTDSSLRTWFPLVAEELEHLQQKVAQAERTRKEPDVAAYRSPEPPELRQRFEIERILVATTAHITREEARKLDLGNYSRGDTGWLIYVNHPSDYRSQIPEISQPSEGLAGAIAQARALGCAYLLLDRDADALEGVPTYDW